MANVSEHLQLSWFLTSQRNWQAWTKTVSGWFGCFNSHPTRAISPPADRVSLTHPLSEVRNVVTPCLRPLGQANRKACWWRYGVRWRKKRMLSCSGVDTDWCSGGIEGSHLHY
jgi:hypothetical protein